MNPILMDIIVHMCAFLALSGDDEVDPDSANKQLEQISNSLHELAPDDRALFVRYTGELAERARVAKEHEFEEFLKELPENLGIQ